MNAINLETTINADGFKLTGGTTPRSVTFTGGDVVIDGGGDVDITFPSSDATLATLALTETLSNKTLASPSFSGTIANLGTVTTVDINGGTLDGVIIGGSSAAAATITTLTITSFAANWTNAGRTVADMGILTTVDINGGTVDGAIIGGASAAAGTFTTIAGATATLTPTSATAGLALAISGAATANLLTMTIDTSAASNKAIVITNATNFAHTGNLVELNLLNATDSARCLQIANAGTGIALHITQKDSTTAATIVINATSANITTADTFIDFRASGGSVGSIAGSAVDGTIAFNTFTGSHWSQSDSILPPRLENGKPVYSIAPGTVLVSTNELCKWTDTETGEDEVNVTLPKCTVSTTAQDKRVYGVYGGHDTDGDILVLGLGSGVVLVKGEIEIGDFLCSSGEPGVAEKYEGSDMRVVVAKARQNHSGAVSTIACTLMAG